MLEYDNYQRSLGHLVAAYDCSYLISDCLAVKDLNEIVNTNFQIIDISYGNCVWFNCVLFFYFWGVVLLSPLNKQLIGKAA